MTKETICVDCDHPQSLCICADFNWPPGSVLVVEGEASASPGRSEAPKTHFLAQGEAQQEHEKLPTQWNCPFCGYGEYKNRDDWKQRVVGHIACCNCAPPAPPETPTVEDAKAELLSTLKAVITHALESDKPFVLIPDDYLEEIDALIAAVQAAPQQNDAITHARQQVIDHLCDCDTTAAHGHSRAVCQQAGIEVIDALIVAVQSSAPPETAHDILTRVDARLRSKLTPALNTGTALEALILVAETIREMRAESADLGSERLRVVARC